MFRIFVENFINETLYTQSINFIEFADGTVLDSSDIIEMIGPSRIPTPTDDKVYHSQTYYLANGGKDLLVGGGSTDNFMPYCILADCIDAEKFYRPGDVSTVIGGQGDDQSDFQFIRHVIYEVSAGDGNDEIRLLPENTLDIKFRAIFTKRIFGWAILMRTSHSQ